MNWLFKLFATTASRKLVSTLALMMVIAIQSSCFAAADELDVSLEAVSATGDSMLVQFTLTNTSDASMRVLPWDTPLEGDFYGDMFTVSYEYETKNIDYIGKLARRRAPQASDYITLAAGESVSAKIDLSEGYATYDAGSYSVTFKNNLKVLDGTGTAKTTGSYREVSPSVDTVLLTLSADREPASSKQTSSFISCSSSRQATLNSAMTYAESYSQTAYSELAGTTESNRSSSTWYTTWFGTYDSTRYSTVTNNFSAIYSAMANQAYTFDCSCTMSNTYAYVYRNQPYKIWICGYYWQDTSSEQYQTMIHETSHWNVIAATNDYVYGKTKCKSLAQSNPNNAIANADNYGYFGINDEGLTMSGSGGGTLPSCPYLYSWTGSGFSLEHHLISGIHSAEQETLQFLPVQYAGLKDNQLIFKIVEIDGENSYINSASIEYRTADDSSSQWQTLDLVAAISNGTDDVSTIIESQDNQRLHMVPGDDIVLTYTAPTEDISQLEFASLTSGYYLWTDETWCEVVSTVAPVTSADGLTTTLWVQVNNMSTEALADNASIEFVLINSDGTTPTVGTVSAAGLAPGEPTWYSLTIDSSEIQDDLVTHAANILIGTTDVTFTNAQTKDTGAVSATSCSGN